MEQGVTTQQLVTAENMARLSEFIHSTQKDTSERYNWNEWRVLNMIAGEAIAGNKSLVVSFGMITDAIEEYLLDKGFEVTEIKTDAVVKCVISWERAPSKKMKPSPPRAK